MGQAMAITTRDLEKALHEGWTIYLFCRHEADTENDVADEIIIRDVPVTDARAKADILEAFDLAAWPEHWTLHRLDGTLV